MWVLKCGDGEKGSIPAGCSWPQRLAAPGMEMHWDKVVPLKWRLSDLLLFNLCPPPVGFGGGAQTSFPSSGWNWPRETSSYPVLQQGQLIPSGEGSTGNQACAHLMVQPPGMGTPSASWVVVAGKWVLASSLTPKHPVKT